MIQLDAGKKIRWPANGFRCDSSDIFAVINGASVFRLTKEYLLPGFSDELTKELQLELRATQRVNIELNQEMQTNTSLEWLKEQLCLALEKPITEKEADTDEVILLLRELSEKIVSKESKSIQSYTPINNSTEGELFL